MRVKGGGVARSITCATVQLHRAGIFSFWGVPRRRFCFPVIRTLCDHLILVFDLVSQHPWDADI